MCSMDNEKRTKFLDLVTANPRLPAGGLPQVLPPPCCRIVPLCLWLDLLGSNRGSQIHEWSEVRCIRRGALRRS